MRDGRKQRRQDQEARLHEAQEASATVDEQTVRVKSQLGLVKRLTLGWKRVHEVNHLANLFRDEGHLG